MDQILLLRYLIEGAEREGTRAFSMLLKDLNITPNQSEVLLVLADYEPLSLKELGDLLVCERKSPSRLVKSLIEKGYVVKAQADEDHRKAVLYLTSAGRRLIIPIKQAEDHFNGQLKEHLLDEQLTTELTQLLLGYLQDTDSGSAIKRRFFAGPTN